jgi:uncharacterized protein (TIGR02996 family)
MPRAVEHAETFFAAEIPNPDERDLVRKIIVDPDDVSSQQIYADWLEDRSDLRAEFLRGELAIKAGKSTKQLLSKQAKMRGKLPPGWLSLIGDTLPRFAELKEKVYRSDRDRGWKPFLKVESVLGLLDINYHADLMCEHFSELLALLATREVAPVLNSLKFDGHEDRGRANGTMPFQLDEWLQSVTEFTNLTSIVMEQGSGVIVGFYDEAGSLARLIEKCPKLLRLTTPSAPNKEFFDGEPHPLRHLDVAVGYDHQDFLLHLTQSSRFPELKVLEIWDYAEDYMDDFAQRCIPFAHWQALLQSPSLQDVKSVTLYSVNLSPTEISSLRRLRKKRLENPSSRT